MGERGCWWWDSNPQGLSSSDLTGHRVYRFRHTSPIGCEPRQSRRTRRRTQQVLPPAIARGRGATGVAGIKRLRVGADKRGTRRPVRGVRLPVAIRALRPPRIRLEVEVLTPCPARTCPSVHAVRLRLFVLTPCPPLPSGEGGRTRLQVPVLTPCPLDRASGFRSSPPVPLSTIWRRGAIGRHQPAPSLLLRTVSRP